MIATITLNPSIDQHIVVRHLHWDDTNRAEGLFRYAGGKGVNVSKAVRELGGKTHAYAVAGGFTGGLWKKLLAEIDIPFSAVSVKEETRINFVLTDLQDGSQTRLSAPGPHVPEKAVRLFLKKVLAVRPKPFLWALGGSLPAGMRASLYREFIHALQKNGTPCILDTDNEALRLGVEAKPFMIKPNEHEIRRLVNRSLKSTGDYLEAARSLVKRGIQIVVVSLGKKGALFVSQKEAFCLSVPDVPVRSKVGAGDCLIGGLAWGLCRKRPLAEAAKLGAAASVSAVMREAPRLCLKKDIVGILPRIAIHPV